MTRQQVAGAPGLVDGLGDRLAPLVPAAQMLRGSESVMCRYLTSRRVSASH